MTRRPDGALEHDVLRVLWAASEPLTPTEINERLDAGYAYTTIATILVRLQAKGLVERTAEGRGYRYRAAVDETDLAVRRIGELLEGSSDRVKVLGRFLGDLSPTEVSAIRSLLDGASGPPPADDAPDGTSVGVRRRRDRRAGDERGAR